MCIYGGGRVHYVESITIEVGNNQGDERVCLLRMDGEYVLRWMLKSQTIRSEWKAFITIKDVFKAKLDKTLHANLFNSTISSAMLYINGTWATTKEKQ